MREDQRSIGVRSDLPALVATTDLDRDDVATTIVPDAMDLMCKGEVHGGELSRVDVAKDVRDRLGRGVVDLVQSAATTTSEQTHLKRRQHSHTPNVVGRSDNLEAM